MRWLIRFFFQQRQGIRFLFVGGYNTAVSYGIFSLLHLFLKQHHHITLAISHVLSVTHAYFLLRWLVFKTQGPMLKEFLRCQLSYLVSFGANFLLLTFFVDYLNVAVLIAQLACIALVATLSYFLHKVFSFR